MGLFGLFGKGGRQAKTAVSQEDHRRLAAALSEVKTHVLNLDSQLGTIHLTLRRHEEEITEFRDLANRHDKVLVRLEEIVNSQPAASAGYTDRFLARSASIPAPSAAATPSEIKSPIYAPARRLDIDLFSEQQRRLLAVFLQNPGRQMSYADMAAILGKSACTVKNQINQIRHKADLFDCVIGPESRNFFKLKDDLKVEKHLKVGRPACRPMSIVGLDQPTCEREMAPQERTFSHTLF